MNATIGASAALLTLYARDGTIDAAAMARFGKWLLARGCSGLLLFGTTGEGPSLSPAERGAALRTMVQHGLPPDRLVVGTGSASLTDAVEMTRMVGEAGCAGALVLPPFFFRTAPAEGLARFVELLLDRTADVGTPIVLYHFPEMSGIGYGQELVEGMMARYPGRITAVKDSSGELPHTLGLIESFPQLAVYTGDDHLIRPVVAAGGAGPMTATANLAPALVSSVYADVRRNPSGAASADEVLLGRLWCEVLLKAPVTEALKFLLHKLTGHPNWLLMRAPLTELDDIAADKVWADFQRLSPERVVADIGSMPPVFQ